MSLHQALPVEGELQMRPDSLIINPCEFRVCVKCLAKENKESVVSAYCPEKGRVFEMFWMWRLRALRPQQVAACPDGPDGVALAFHASA